MSWENQQMAGPSSLKELLAHQPQIVSQTEPDRIELLTQRVNELQEQIQSGAPRKAPKARKATLVSIDAKIDLILNILSQNS